MNLTKIGFEAIILAGGLGTRLKTVTGETPKPLADIAGKPFLTYLLSYLSQQGCKKFILSTCYRQDLVAATLGDSFCGIPITYIVESSPLGTGGAVREAFSAATDDDVAVLNGDTFFGVDLVSMLGVHKAAKKAVTIALKPMKNFERYGSVTLNGDTICGFEEKGPRSSGYINGGVYFMNRSLLPLLESAGTVFSLESDILQKQVSLIKPTAFVSDAYFIDIGIPDDYRKACSELPLLLAKGALV